MQMMISLYNVLIYLQKQLNILAHTYLLLQRRRRALYLMFFSDGKKKKHKTRSKMINQLINCKYQLITRL